MTFKAAKCPNCGGALQVPDDLATVKCMYCGVDVVVREAIQLAAGRVKEFTAATPVRRLPRSCGCAAASIVFGAVLILCALVALFGRDNDVFVAGILFIVALIFIIPGIFSSSRKRTERVVAFKGKCPYCETSITLVANIVGADCPACKKRIVIRDMQFISVDTPVSGLKRPEQ